MPDFKPTLQLPDPDFSIPMKANLPTLEPRIQAKWADMDIYRAIQRDRANAEVFSLHDGPPYTNSPIHMGTAFNKILKDFVVKSQTMMGKRAPFVPGYDNHGLPIEMAVQKRLAAEGKGHPDVLTLRKACREHAEHYIGVQTEQFMRLGVFGTWDKPYTSMGFAYEAEIVRVFRRLVEAATFTEACDQCFGRPPVAPRWPIPKSFTKITLLPPSMCGLPSSMMRTGF